LCPAAMLYSTPMWRCDWFEVCQGSPGVAPQLVTTAAANCMPDHPLTASLLQALTSPSGTLSTIASGTTVSVAESPVGGLAHAAAGALQSEAGGEQVNASVGHAQAPAAACADARATAAGNSMWTYIYPSLLTMPAHRSVPAGCCGRQ
jgi:hypothetical protein